LFTNLSKKVISNFGVQYLGHKISHINVFVFKTKVLILFLKTIGCKNCKTPIARTIKKESILYFPTAVRVEIDDVAAGEVPGLGDKKSSTRKTPPADPNHSSMGETSKELQISKIIQMAKISMRNTLVIVSLKDGVVILPDVDWTIIILLI